MKDRQQPPLSHPTERTADVQITALVAAVERLSGELADLRTRSALDVAELRTRQAASERRVDDLVAMFESTTVARVLRQERRRDHAVGERYQWIGYLVDSQWIGNIEATAARIERLFSRERAPTLPPATAAAVEALRGFYGAAGPDRRTIRRAHDALTLLTSECVNDVHPAS